MLRFSARFGQTNNARFSVLVLEMKEWGLAFSGLQRGFNSKIERRRSASRGQWPFCSTVR